MAIVEQTISAALLAMQNELAEETDSDEAKQKSADKLAKIIADAIKSATVNPGIPVQVAVATGTGATAGPGTLS